MRIKEGVVLLLSALFISSSALAYYDYGDDDGYYSGYDGGYGSYYGDGGESYHYQKYYGRHRYRSSSGYGRYHGSYMSRLPQQISSSADTIVVDPSVHAWGAYSGGRLVKAGLASAGSNYCKDLHRPCRTRAGYYHIQSLGSAGCKSTRFPLGKGGAPMPYCMYFNGNFALHGSYELAEGNISHGCVRMHVDDARWIRYNFARVGTPVIVRSY